MTMARGNQRELAREKNLKKQNAPKKKDDMPLEKRKARDTAALQQKQKAPINSHETKVEKSSRKKAK
ncbi:unnamed protein product [Ceutorhynchus assimilis]|uniref:Small EDRK-rich factor-like N-terminal domain-containing protein n=1 Tax=Ceutorhynchus assimilis TaxID=467358 RepID=A0A9N9MXJ6_9CUCU|nr:unnamed protein product [Ceutorhynchus assimilis]